MSITTQWEDKNSGTYTLRSAGNVCVTGRFFIDEETHQLRAITNETHGLRYTLDALRELQNAKNIALAPNVELTQVDPSYQSMFFTREELSATPSHVQSQDARKAQLTGKSPYANFIITAAQTEREEQQEVLLPKPPPILVY